MLRVLIVDDHPIVRLCVRHLIEAHPGWEVCGEAWDGPSALAAALAESPDVAIIDVGLPILNGLALTRQLKRDRPATRVLLFTAHDEDETVSAGLSAGARGFLLKSDAAEHLEPAVAALGAGRTYFSSYVADLLLHALDAPLRRSPIECFTPRELQVAQLIAEARSNKEMARDLGISLKTIETHRSAIMRKSAARNAAEFTRFALKNNLIER